MICWNATVNYQPSRPELEQRSGNSPPRIARIMPTRQKPPAKVANAVSRGWYSPVANLGRACLFHLVMWEVRCVVFRKNEEPISGYRLARQLGRGAFGEVWQAVGPGRTNAALKFLRLVSGSGQRELCSIQKVKDIRHAHLLPISAYWVIDEEDRVLNDGDIDRLCDVTQQSKHARGVESLTPRQSRSLVLIVAMPVGDKNLLERLIECQESGAIGIPIRELLSYLEDAAKGIDFLNSPRHDLGQGSVAVQHCDIKPQNILLVGDSAMVCDFGLAQILGCDRTATGMLGSPAYMSPEMIEGRKPSRYSDQYSLAMTYVELRTGELPFERDSVVAAMDAHLQGEIDLSRLSPPERTVLRRATSRKPEERYPSCRAMVAALQEACASQERTCSQPSSVISRAGIPGETEQINRSQPARVVRARWANRRIAAVIVGLAIATVAAGISDASSTIRNFFRSLESHVRRQINGPLGPPPQMDPAFSGPTTDDPTKHPVADRMALPLIAGMGGSSNPWNRNSDPAVPGQYPYRHLEPGYVKLQRQRSVGLERTTQLVSRHSPPERSLLPGAINVDGSSFSSARPSLHRSEEICAALQLATPVGIGAGAGKRIPTKMPPEALNVTEVAVPSASATIATSPIPLRLVGATMEAGNRPTYYLTNLSNDGVAAHREMISQGRVYHLEPSPIRPELDEKKPIQGEEYKIRYGFRGRIHLKKQMKRSQMRRVGRPRSRQRNVTVH